jgi:RecB family exonuclease
MRPTGDKPPVLPHALGEVRPPAYLSPSRFSDLLRCPLSVVHGLREEESLAPHPLAILGRITHDVVDEVRSANLATKKDIEDAVDAIFEERLGEVEARLAALPSTSRFVPLRRAVGRTDWRQRKARLRTWAATLYPRSGHSPRRDGKRFPSQKESERGDETSATTKIPFGSEQPMIVPDLRLSGRPDHIERDSEGVIHITDLKTGRVLDGHNPRGDYALQVRLYGLMVEWIDPNARVRLWLEGSERVEIPWNDTVRAEVEESLSTMLADLPPDRSLPAESLAREGLHCGRCQIRHRCPRYRRAAPEWWNETSTVAPVAPFDTWGTLLGVNTKDGSSYEVLLRDAAGRKVRVSGLESGAGIEDLCSGDYVWFFDLEPTETLPHHGTFAHPHNFHEMRPSRAWSDALRLQVFYGADDTMGNASS